MKIFTIIKDSSERVKDKNFRVIGGMPLWKFSLQKFIGHEIFINSDSSRVLSDEWAQKNKFVLIRRRQEHIDWETASQSRGSPVEAMFLEFANTYVDDMDEPIALVHVTSPFLKVESVISAAQYLNQGFSSVHSVRAVQDFCWVRTTHDSHQSESYLPVNFDASRVQRTQDLEPVLQSLGAFFITTKRTLVTTGRRLAEPTKYVHLELPEAIEIDTPLEFDFAEKVAHAFS